MAELVYDEFALQASHGYGRAPGRKTAGDTTAGAAAAVAAPAATVVYRQRVLRRAADPTELVVADGVPYPAFITPAQLAAARARAQQMEPDDLLIAAFPKSGTTWVQYIVQLIVHRLRLHAARCTRETAGGRHAARGLNGDCVAGVAFSAGTQRSGSSGGGGGCGSSVNRGCSIEREGNAGRARDVGCDVLDPALPRVFLGDFCPWLERHPAATSAAAGRGGSGGGPTGWAGRSGGGGVFKTHLRPRELSLDVVAGDTSDGAVGSGCGAESAACSGTGPPGPSVVVVVRDAKDVCASQFHHWRSHYAWRGRSGEFFERFARGDVDFGSAFEWLAEWRHAARKWALAAAPRRRRVLFVHFEALVADPHGQISRLAAFVRRVRAAAGTGGIDDGGSGDGTGGDGAGVDADTVAWVAAQAALPRMRSNPFANCRWMPRARGSPPHLRRGVVGDWVNQLTPQQACRLDMLAHDRQRPRPTGVGRAVRATRGEPR